MISLTELSEKILKEKSVALFCHARPDGDTVGSACALKLALIAKGIRAETFCSDAIPQKFLFLSEPNKIVNDYCGDFSEFTALIAIDNAEITRLGDFADAFFRHNNTYSIDHHVSNTRYAKINYVADKASNAENIFALIKEMKAEITAEIADLLATGIMTDTGGFRHKNVTAETFFAAGELCALGANMNEIYFQTFTRQTKERAELFGRTMSKIRFFFGGRAAIATVRLKDFAETCAMQEETEGFIDFVMSVNGVEIGACVMETDNCKFKISLRSKSADVNAVAAVFGGGGHKLASGCKITGEYEDVVDRLTVAIGKYLDD
ncbi:MAG: bifunctional oligoribonuclease/PAP phosphatase NrnA [Clostridia bacterium]|nr:bifunctional oligoribonuclease/PAP phosphatase NrnA [Clostridia bacterium]